MIIKKIEIPIIIFLTTGLALEYLSISLGQYTGIALTIFYLYITKLIWTRLSSLIYIGLGTLTLEAIGLHTGIPFGHYKYGEIVAHPAIFNVPTFIPLAWFILISATRQISSKWFEAGLLIVAIDIILEIFATTTGLWTWQDHKGPLTAPIQNYITWGITGTIGYFIVPKNKNLKQIAIKIIALLLGYMTIVIAIHNLK